MIGHYYMKFLEEWTSIQPADPKKQSDVSKSMAIMQDIGKKASHWVLSPDAMDLVWQTDIYSADFTGIRLPYEYMILEYQFDYERLGMKSPAVSFDRQPCRARFLVMIEVSESHVVMLTGYKLEKSLGSLPENMNWVFSPVGLMLSYEGIEKISEWMVPEDDGVRVEVQNKYCAIIPAAPMFKDLIDSSDAKSLEAGLLDTFDELRIALGLMAVLSCDNVPVTTIEAPAKLNKKRQKSGKPPIPTYRTLHITSHESRASRSAGGSHSSKRAHWRRGHIRNQPTSKGVVRKWIRPMIIGAGVPDKPEVVLT